MADAALDIVNGRTSPKFAGIHREDVRLVAEPFLGIGKIQFAPLVSERLFAKFAAVSPPLSGTSVSVGDVVVAWLAPNEWLVIGSEAAVHAALRKCETVAGDRGLACDLTHARASFILSGNGAHDRLSSVTSLDVSERRFPINAVARAPLGETGMFIARLHGEEGSPAFRIIVDQTMAQYAHRMLAGSDKSKTGSRP